MDPFNYFPFFILAMSGLAFMVSTRYVASADFSLQEKGNRNILPPLILCIILVLWMGGRPVHVAFGDTVNYAAGYSNLVESATEMDWSSEWVWQWLMVTCHSAGFTINDFFTIVEFGYIFSLFWAVKILMPRNVMLAMLFVLTSFMFFTFGVNGLRNGLACHMILLAMALFLSDRYWGAAFVALAAFGIHRSVMLPIASFLSTVYVLKKPKYALWFWISSIFLSLVAGGFFIAFFSGLGFDDRMSSYATDESYFESSGAIGFRWDFLLYSAMPVLLGWYVCIKKKCSDNWYNVLYSTYCLCNAFWVLVIRASYSNRFAYLSWFMYPIVVAYPLIQNDVWFDQDQKTGEILIGYFTLTLGICYFTGLL